MRVDKFLWSVRYFKTRTMVTELCKKNHVMVNEQTVKPSKEVKVGDKITFRRDQINYIIKVLDLPKNRLGAPLVDLYRLDITPEENLKHLEMLKLAKDHYRKFGEGRPTKKDRRDLDEFNLTPNPSPKERGI